MRGRHYDRVNADPNPPPRPAERRRVTPTPWLIIREHLAQTWGLVPWEVPHPDDHADPLADEVGRWLEIEALKARWP